MLSNELYYLCSSTSDSKNNQHCLNVCVQQTFSIACVVYDFLIQMVQCAIVQ